MSKFILDLGPWINDIGQRSNLHINKSPGPNPRIAANVNWVLSGRLEGGLRTPCSQGARETISGHYAYARSHCPGTLSFKCPAEP